MGKDLHKFYCKYGPYLIIGILLCLLMISQYKMGPVEETMKDLGLPKATLSDSLENYNSPNTYVTRAQASKGESITFLVRTYKNSRRKSVG